MTRLFHTFLLVSAVIAGNSAPAPAAIAEPVPPGLPAVPAADPFYAQPASFDGSRMGEIVASRVVDVRDIPARAPLTSWQVKYVSQDSGGTPWTTVATIIRPAGGARTSELVAFDPWIDALDARCNPSYQLRAGAAYLASTGMITEMTSLVALLDHGYTVVVPDYLGPENQFTASYVEGRNTLDGIRAALNFAPAGLSQVTPVGMFGFSGGARGTEFAAELAPDYAPELNLVGSVAIGLPVDLSNSGRRMNKSIFTGIDVISAFALDRAYPDLNTSAMFKDPGLGSKVGGMCNVEAEAAFAFADGADMTFGRLWPLDDPKVAAVVQTLRAGRLGTPRAPLYLAVGVNDQVALPDDNDRLAADYRDRGVDLTYVKLPVVEHVTSIVVAAAPAMDWLAERLDRAGT
ncbi:lipase family protein [Nocardia sp. NPDC088792]|uniref:lipase family protein n=1 Tax=Nocardia sp. NPDC088792 TaxID=3364332 RepID=UPI00381AF3D8